MDDKEGNKALFQYAIESILVVNKNGEIVSVNPSAQKLFGYDKAELIGKEIEVLIPKRLSEKHVKHREAYVNNPHPRAMGPEIGLNGLKKDGSEFPLEINLSPYSDSDGQFVIAFIIDITARKQAEEIVKNSMELEKRVKNRTLILEEAIEELEKTKKELNNALNMEKELNELKSRFVSMASHEFRTPLTTMLSSLSLITRYGDQNDSENQHKHINKIKSSIANMTDILNDFLSVSKLEEGKVTNISEEFNLREFIEDIIHDMKYMAIEEHKFHSSYSGNETVFLDKKLIKNILFNLISNAIKFSPNGGTIEVNVNISDQVVKISVKDNGIGIPVEDQKHLFERFFRGNNVTHIQGTGLGLNIVLKYAELMNGSLDFQSEENKGSTFVVSIPIPSNPINISA